MHDKHMNMSINVIHADVYACACIYVYLHVYHGMYIIPHFYSYTHTTYT